MRLGKVIKVGIIHKTTFSRYGGGGGEVLSLELASVLKELGFGIIYITEDLYDWRYYNRISDVDLRVDGEIALRRPPLFKAYDVFLDMFRLSVLRRSIGLDLVINTNGGAAPIPFVDVTYIHSPLRVNLWRSWSSFRKAYLLSLNHIIRWFSIHGKLGLILTNSRFTRMEIRKFMGSNSVVLYPPVDVERYMRYMDVERRDRLVVSIGRFVPKKRYEDLIEIASKVNDAKFIIIGTISDLNYLRSIVRLVKDRNLSNVIIKPNASFQEKLEILSKARIYLHTARTERFGISIVEGMAAGCVPIVYRSRGPWLDILEEKQGVHGFAYRNLDEAVSMINNVLNDDRLSREIVNNNKAHVLKFSRDTFRKKVSLIVNKILKARGLL